MDITQLTLDDHQEQRRLFSILEQLDRTDTKSLAAMWKRLAAFLEVHAEAEEQIFYPEVLWTVVCLVVLVLIVMHGVFVTPTMHALDRQTEELASLSSGAIVTPPTTVSPLNGGLVAEPNGAVSEHAVRMKR